MGNDSRVRNSFAPAQDIGKPHYRVLLAEMVADIVFALVWRVLAAAEDCRVEDVRRRQGE